MGPRVIGIDPSLTGTGIARADGGLSVIGGDAALGDKRLQLIHSVVATVLDHDRPELAVIEDLPTHAHGAGKLGMVQGVVRYALLHAGVSYVALIPSVVKKYATGNGGASKSDMRMALYRRTGVDERDDNKVDAFWLRAAGLDWLNCPTVNLPAAQRAVLARAAWPCGVSGR